MVRQESSWVPEQGLKGATEDKEAPPQAPTLDIAQVSMLSQCSCHSAA